LAPCGAISDLESEEGEAVNALLHVIIAARAIAIAEALAGEPGLKTFPLFISRDKNDGGKMVIFKSGYNAEAVEFGHLNI
jgi:hypothetical protein